MAPRGDQAFDLKEEVARRRAEDRRLRRCRYLHAEYHEVRCQSAFKNKTDAEVYEAWQARLNQAEAQGMARRQAMKSKLDNPYLSDEMLAWFFSMRGKRLDGQAKRDRKKVA